MTVEFSTSGSFSENQTQPSSVRVAAVTRSIAAACIAKLEQIREATPGGEPRRDPHPSRRGTCSGTCVRSVKPRPDGEVAGIALGRVAEDAWIARRKS